MNNIKFISRFDGKGFEKLEKRQQIQKNIHSSKKIASVIFVGSSSTSQTVLLTGFGRKVVPETASVDCEVAIGTK